MNRFRQLIDTLPKATESIEDEARNSLRFLLDQIEARTHQTEPVPENPNLCPNCDQPSTSTRSPYCGSECREVASFVRQFRNGLVEGTLLDIERQFSMGQVLWHLLGGGRPLRQHIIMEKVRKQVLAKNGGLCSHCEEPAVSIDHIATGCNRPINLQPVCVGCAVTRPFGDPEVTGTASFQTLLEELAIRIGSDRPVRGCDDAEAWDWRVYVGKRS